VADERLTIMAGIDALVARAAAEAGVAPAEVVTRAIVDLLPAGTAHDPAPRGVGRPATPDASVVPH
jgi:hypothetical protein